MSLFLLLTHIMQFMLELLSRAPPIPQTVVSSLATPTSSVPLRRAASTPAVPSRATNSAPTTQIASPLQGEQKRRAEALTSVFENGTPTINYAAIEQLDDGRGYTAGRAGFTTATGDAFLVVKRYTERVPQNPLAKYLPTLERLAESESNNVSELEGFAAAWREAAHDARFRAAQDAINDELYFEPAMDMAKSLGVATALGQAILYDTIIQHGGGTDADGLSALVARTKNRVGGTPKTGIAESQWLSAFLDVRAQDLLHPANTATQEVWAVSVSRVRVFEKLLRDNNLALRGPIVIRTPEYEATIE